MDKKSAKVPLDCAMSLQEAEQLLEIAGEPAKFIKRVSDVGEQIAKRTDTAFALGALVEEINTLRFAIRECKTLAETTQNEKIRSDTLANISKLSLALTHAVRDLAKLQVENRENVNRSNKPKARSFAPDQQVTAIKPEKDGQ